MYKFNGFTSKATKALNIAILSAQELGHTYIGSEHIILGFLRESSCIAGKILKEFHVSEYIYYSELTRRLSIGDKSVLCIADFTPRAKRILKSAHRYSTNRSSLVGTDCILISLMRENNSIANIILNSLGVTRAKVEEKIRSFSYLEYSFYPEPKVKTSKLLEAYGTNLNNRATQKSDPLVGREKEINRVIQILSRRNKNNPCLIGDPGVGKTAIAEGLALKIIQKDVPWFLKDKKIVSLNLTCMVAGTRYRGDFEERVKNIINEVKKDRDIILFIDELHSIVGTGSAEGSPDIANILKPSLSNGDIQIIGATTVEEYRRFIAKDPALERRFSPVTVEEPSFEETINIINGIKDRYEAFHNIKISKEAVECSVKLSSRYITDRFLPDKAIDLLDEAGSKLKIKNDKRNIPNFKSITENADDISDKKDQALIENDIESLAELKNREKENNVLLENYSYFDNFPIDVSIDNINTEISQSEIKAEHIADIVSSWTGIPISELNKNDKARLFDMEARIKKYIIGQDEAIKIVSSALKRSRTGIKDINKPIGSFLFLGPTGVGKTQLCKTIAKLMFGKEEDLIRFDMSEFMEKHSIARLIGSPPGYVGYEKGGELTERVKKRPYSILLFDEIEKAHPDIINIFLQLLDDGQLTDSQGRKIDFKNTIVIFTSNIGAKIISTDISTIGFENKSDESDRKKELVLNEAKKAFKPELLNRIDESIVFNNLTIGDNIQITKILLKELEERLKEQDITLHFTERIIKYVAEKGFDKIYGARPLKRFIQRNIENRLADKIISSEINKESKVICDYEKEIIIKEELALAGV